MEIPLLIKITDVELPHFYYAKNKQKNRAYLAY